MTAVAIPEDITFKIQKFEPHLHVGDVRAISALREHLHLDLLSDSRRNLRFLTLEVPNITGRMASRL